MPLFNSFLSLLVKRRLKKITYFKNYPAEVQDETLMLLLHKSRNTEWGKRYDFKNIDSPQQFKEKVPLQDYDSLKGDIDRLRKGEQNILWPSDTRWFAKSSGTTSDRSKFIPVSKEALDDCHYRGGKDIIVFYTHSYPNTKIFKGKGLILGGSHKIDSSRVSYYGDLSAILIENLPSWAHLIRTPNPEIALIEEWEEKLEKITDTTLNKNVTSLLGVPSWNLVLINHLLKTTGKKDLLKIWPELEVFVHGGVNFEPYREQFKKLIPSSHMNYMETYNASEGFFAIQDDLNDPSMLLMLDYGIFYEFIPMNELEKKNPKTLTIEKVEPGKNYALVITTNAGLWRYMIGDTLMFTSTFPHKIKITGRTKLFINAFGEEIIIDNAEKAVTLASQNTGAVVKDYTAAPVFMGKKTKGTHEWLVEFEKMPDSTEAFMKILDKALQNLNSDYAAKRYKNITMAKPILQLARKNLFYDWLKRKGKLGGQNKVPRLNNHRKIIEELLQLNG